VSCQTDKAAQAAIERSRAAGAPSFDPERLARAGAIIGMAAVDKKGTTYVPVGLPFPKRGNRWHLVAVKADGTTVPMPADMDRYQVHAWAQALAAGEVWP
jgi:hypothetical protein